MAIAVKSANVKPPLTKTEILQATAQALADEHAERVKENREQQKERTAKRDAKLFLMLRQRLMSVRTHDESVCRVNVGYSLKKGHSEVSLEFDIPESDIPRDLEGFARIPEKSVEAFLFELKRAQKAQPNLRVEALLDDETIKAKLVEAGKQLLGTREPGPVIEV